MKNKASKSKAILLTAFIAGTLDILAAILVYGVIMQRATALQILKGIAAGLFGKTVIGNETVMAIIGLILHYFIVLFYRVLFFCSQVCRFITEECGNIWFAVWHICMDGDEPDCTAFVTSIQCAVFLARIFAQRYNPYALYRVTH